MAADAWPDGEESGFCAATFSIVFHNVQRWLSGAATCSVTGGGVVDLILWKRGESLQTLP